MLRSGKIFQWALLKLDDEDSMQKAVNDIYESMKSIRNNYGIKIDHRKKEIKEKVEVIYFRIENEKAIDTEDEITKNYLKVIMSLFTRSLISKG